LSTVPSKLQPLGCAALFFAVFLVAGLALAWGTSLRPLLGILRASGWERTPCVVLGSRVDVREDSDGDTYKAVVRYAWVRDGRRFESERYDFFDNYSSGRRGKREVVSRFAAGSESHCWVNPRDPSEAVLSRTLELGGFILALFPLPFIAVGAGGLAWALKARRDARRDREREGMPGTPPGPVVLAPETNLRAKAFTITGLAATWNGLLGVALTLARREATSFGNGTWLIFGILGLIGLLLLISIPGQLRAAFRNPSPILTLERPVEVGRPVRLDWRLEGNARLLRLVRIELEGCETVQDTGGSETETFAEAFFHETVTVSTDPIGLAAGTARLLVPPGLVPSFKAENNEVAYRLRLYGEMPRKPHVEAVFPLAVSAPEVLA
jgi:hypothetical protein